MIFTMVYTLSHRQVAYAFESPLSLPILGDFDLGFRPELGKLQNAELGERQYIHKRGLMQDFKL